MPALVWCGRRWRTGSDDFTFSSSLYAACLIVVAILGLSRITERNPSGPDAPEKSHFYLRTCAGASTQLTVSFLCLSIVDLVAAVLFVLTSCNSLRGAIYELSKRSLVPMFLYFNTASLVLTAVVTVFCAKYAIFDGERHLCGSFTNHILFGSLVANFIICVLFAFSLAFVYDPTGRAVYDTPEDYERTWWKRCQLLCCRCDREKLDDDAFKDVATVFSQAFCAYDMVPSDLAAGLLLLHGYQYHSRRIVRERVLFAPPPSTQGAPPREWISSQAVPAKRLTDAQRELVRDLQRYSRFYMAAYGYLLFEFRHCCTGLPRLCCFDPCMCCRHRQGRHYGSTCFCDVTALLRETHIPEEDLLLTSWSNEVFKPVHYVCYDRSTNAIVIAVRGTMSFTDVATDFAASPVVVELADAHRNDSGKPFAPSDFYVHGGMLASAQYVWRSLDYNGVLDVITRGTYCNTKVVVLGHSLGGGVALILSVLMHSELPAVRDRLRCFAYSPPGGTLSEAVVEYCKDFTAGAFMGYDMIPRLAMHTFEAFREAIFDVTAASPIPKSLVYLNVMRTAHVTRSIHPSAATPASSAPFTPLTAADGPRVRRRGDLSTEVRGASTESARYREELRHGNCVPLSRPKKLFPCKTLIHFRKAVERATNAYCHCCSEEEWGVCSCCGGPPVTCVEDIYYPCVEGPQDVQMLIAAPTMFTDHMPERLFDLMKVAVERMDSHELERFYQDEDPEELPETVAPLYYISPTAAAAVATAGAMAANTGEGPRAEEQVDHPPHARTGSLEPLTYGSTPV